MTSVEPRNRAAAWRSRLQAWWDVWIAPVWDDPRVLISACERAYLVWRAGGFQAMSEWYAWKVHLRTLPIEPAEWWSRYQRGAWRQRLAWRRRDPSGPTFTILLAPRQEQVSWWRSAIDSVRQQTYGNWELLCVVPSDTSPSTRGWLRRLEAGEPRLRVLIDSDQDTDWAFGSRHVALTQVTGGYVCFLNEADTLEPSALARWADAAAEGADLLYGDEVLAAHDLNRIEQVRALPAFSYDFFLAHDFLPELWSARVELVRAVRAEDLDAVEGRDELLLRLIERSASIAHVPGIVSRQRCYPGRSPDLRSRPSARAVAVRRHLARLGWPAEMVSLDADTMDLSHPVPPGVRVAAIIPTRNRHDLLAKCIATLEPLTTEGVLDLTVIDHESDESETRALLQELAKKHRVLPYHGTFNFSAMMNLAIEQLDDSYTHYLLLNNDIEALDSHWLRHMLGLGSRREVGVVGATLLYPDRRVQHAGVVTGLCGAAAHAHVLEPLDDAAGSRRGGYLNTLTSTRDVSAVTGACLLVRADVVRELGGFDERLRVGFGDVDLCLRARAAGYKVLLDAQAVLLHHESVTRGKRFWGTHPDDNLYFAARYLRRASASDPFYNPLLSPITAKYVLNRAARATRRYRPRQQAVVLPSLASYDRQSGRASREAA